MVGWHHQLHGHEFEQTLRDSEGQGSLACFNSWGCKKLDTTERVNNNKRKNKKKKLKTWVRLVLNWVRLVLSSYDITTIDPKTWLVAHNISNSGHSILFLLMKLHMQTIKLLTRRVLKISPSEAQVVVCRFKMSSCGSSFVVDIWASDTPKLRTKNYF